MKTFETDFQVRGYELDSFGHVNHAVYLNYAEFARWRMMEEAAGSANALGSNGLGTVVVRVESDYRAPCYLSEWIRVDSHLEKIGRTSCLIRHIVKKRDSGIVSAELSVTLVCIDASRKPVPFPSEFVRTLLGESS